MSTPEEASEYLARTNFKSIIEWVTAEAVLHRPDDPVSFVRNILEAKVDARGGQPFAPEQPTEYVRGCYAEAANLADEHGVIHGKAVGGSGGTVSNSAAAVSRLAVMERLVRASNTIADSLEPFDASNAIVQEACSILGADRATIFLVNNDKTQLSLMMAEGSKEVTVPVGVGIAGTVADTGSNINIPDCYEDSRFDPSFDKKTGYKTNNMLCTAIKDGSGDVFGVLQIINKADGPFTLADEEVCALITKQAGVCLRNAQVHKAQVMAQRRMRHLTDLVKAIQGGGTQIGNSTAVNNLVFTIQAKAPAIVSADRCTVFLLDEKGTAITSQQGDVTVKIELDQPGIATTVCKFGEILNIPDAYSDNRFNQEVDRKTGYTTSTILCVPLKDSDGSPIGALQLVNKVGGAFEAEDEEMMTIFTDIAGPMVAASRKKSKAK